MTQLAFAGLEGKVVVDSREVLRDGPTYTLDTLHELQREQPGAQLVLIMGADQATRLAELARLAGYTPHCYRFCSISRTIDGRHCSF
jgi:nicotinic acid mononucleotide adenylyltransferase